MVLFVLFYVLIQLTVVCLGSGKIEVRLMQFSNEDGKKADGRCCDENNDWSFDLSSFFSDYETQSPEVFCGMCDHVFKICVDDIDPASDCKQTSPISVNQIFFYEDVGGIPNPLVFSFETLKGNATLNIDVSDSDYGEYIMEPIGKLTHQINKKAESNKELTYNNIKMIVEYEVYCDPNYYDRACTKYCERTNDDQRGHYTCSPFGDKICSTGWTGDDCNEKEDHCRNHTCHSSATCVSEIGRYHCLCPVGRTGQFCDAEINECTSAPCKNGATCHKELGGYSCQCTETWTGRLCETQIIDCPKSYCKHGFCVSSNSAFKCICNEGYSGDLCDIHIGQCNSDPCYNNANCEDLPGDYKCHCPTGYTGKNCESRISACDSNPCLNNGACLQLGKRFRCFCRGGFFGSRCENQKDQCGSSPCKNGGTCQTLPGTYRCLCPVNATGFNCDVAMDACQSRPCQNSGTCVPENDSYKCICPPNIQGASCEVVPSSPSDPCQKFPCKNNGTCSPLQSDYLCYCPQGYTGKNCEENLCDCKNGGKCEVINNKFSCVCQTGFEGKNCEDLLPKVSQIYILYFIDYYIFLLIWLNVLFETHIKSCKELDN
uniref:Delta-like protein n=1 Tax=Biomphalaria glabrata TaxID=6526 RepID=A0A2C9K6C7_BIOGL